LVILAPDRLQPVQSRQCGRQKKVALPGNQTVRRSVYGPQLGKSFFMTDSHYERADTGRMLRTAITAALLILAGLGVMAWDDGRTAGRAPASLHRHS